LARQFAPGIWFPWKKEAIGRLIENPLSAKLFDGVPLLEPFIDITSFQVVNLWGCRFDFNPPEINHHA
jgi:hypothetical protein